MMTDESLLEWARGWLKDDTVEDPTFRERFLTALGVEMRAHRQPRIDQLERELAELRRVGRAIASYQPAAHATTDAEADLWVQFYGLVDEV